MPSPRSSSPAQPARRKERPPCSDASPVTFEQVSAVEPTLARQKPRIAGCLPLRRCPAALENPAALERRAISLAGRVGARVAGCASIAKEAVVSRLRRPVRGKSCRRRDPSCRKLRRAFSLHCATRTMREPPRYYEASSSERLWDRSPSCPRRNLASRRCPPIAPAHVPERPIASRSVLIASAAFVPQLQRPQPFLGCSFEEEGSAPGKNRTCDLGFRKRHKTRGRRPALCLVTAERMPQVGETRPGQTSPIRTRVWPVRTRVEPIRTRVWPNPDRGGADPDRGLADPDRVEPIRTRGEAKRWTKFQPHQQPQPQPQRRAQLPDGIVAARAAARSAQRAAGGALGACRTLTSCVGPRFGTGGSEDPDEARLRAGPAHGKPAISANSEPRARLAFVLHCRSHSCQRMH
jgi:hypothetical protein